MRLRRKTAETDAVTSATGAEPGTSEGATAEVRGPFDVEAAPANSSRVDFGGLLVTPPDGAEVQLQIDQGSGAIVSLLLAQQDGAIELRAFSAPRNGDLWSQTIPGLKADVARRGGTTQDATGPFGAEVVSQVAATLPDGQQGWNVNRFIGVNGSRWMLRATLIGAPALDPDDHWYQIVESVVVRRGKAPMPAGEQLVLRPPAEMAEEFNRVQQQMANGAGQ